MNEETTIIIPREVLERLFRLCLVQYLSGKTTDKDLESFPYAKRLLWSYFRGKTK